MLSKSQVQERLSGLTDVQINARIKASYAHMEEYLRRMNTAEKISDPMQRETAVRYWSELYFDAEVIHDVCIEHFLTDVPAEGGFQS